MGRTSQPFGTFKIRPPAWPPVMRMEKSAGTPASTPALSLRENRRPCLGKTAFLSLPPKRRKSPHRIGRGTG